MFFLFFMFMLTLTVRLFWLINSQRFLVYSFHRSSPLLFCSHSSQSLKAPLREQVCAHKCSSFSCSCPLKRLCGTAGWRNPTINSSKRKKENVPAKGSLFSNENHINEICAVVLLVALPHNNCRIGFFFSEKHYTKNQSSKIISAQIIQLMILRLM